MRKGQLLDKVEQAIAKRTAKQTRSKEEGLLKLIMNPDYMAIVEKQADISEEERQEEV